MLVPHCTLPLRVLVQFAAKYCSNVWCCSAHTCLINKPINDALHIVTVCLHSTPIDNLFVLAGILPTELCSKQTILSLACQAKRPKHILNKRLLSPLIEDIDSSSQDIHLCLLQCNY